MFVAISAAEFDAFGHVVIDAWPDPSFGGDRLRRVTRTATLDGGAVVNDFGYSDADITFVIRWTPGTAAYEANVARLLQEYAQLVVATRNGAFLAAPESYRTKASESTLTLLVIRKLSE